MQNIEKRIDKLKSEKKKLNEKVIEYQQKISDIDKKIEELENVRIVTAFRSTGYSLEDVITRISSLAKDSECSDKDDDFEKKFAALEAAEKEKHNEV